MPNKRSFSDVFKKYKTYKPEREGFGNVHQWSKAFKTVMGKEEAIGVLSGHDPLTILGFTYTPTMAELKKQYRKLILANHPDRGGDAAKAREIIAAYTILSEQIE